MINVTQRRIISAVKSSKAPVQSRSLFGFSNNSGSNNGTAAKEGWSASAQGSGKSTGRLRKVGKVMLYEETREMSYTPKQLYSVIADVDSYHSFLPFATTSKVLSAAYRDRSQSAAFTTSKIGEKGWLNDQAECEAERWELAAELKIGAMGYEEGYVSRVELKKWSSVTATAKDSSLFKHLVTQWTLSPLAHSSSDGRPRTKVDLSLAYAFASPFHAAAASTVWERVSGMMVGGFEGRVESVYGK